jgi:hypothetical protein
MSKISKINGVRYRVEQKITFYSPKDKRKKAGTYTKIQYSDGRCFTDSKHFNGYNHIELLQDLECIEGDRLYRLLIGNRN